MARPRKQTYTLDMYLRKNRKGDIDNNADVQRNFVWNNEQINELVVTVLTDDYIPPIILGEETNSRLHIVDGGQRTAALIKYRYGNHKITSSIENSIIPYKKKAASEDGKIIYEDAVFDIKNKTFEKLPDELKEKFDEYQIETVIHESCDSFIISRYIKRYNNHVAMNTEQKAFTYIDKFASRIREIVNSKFFVECNNYSEKDKTKGVVERIVVESMMCMNHFDNWKTQPKPAFKYLNDHAAEEEFDMFADNLHRLEKIITKDIKNIFNKKDSFIFLTLFDKFARLGLDDEKFAEFLREFQCKLRPVKRNDKGLLFDEIDKDASTKDKQVITDKLHMLENLMLDFLHIDNTNFVQINIESFIARNLDIDVETVQDDMDFYNESLNELLDHTVKIDSKLRNEENRFSLLAMMVYSYKEDKDLDEWMTEYARRNNTYFIDQKKNFLHMKNDFEKYLKRCA
jgi:rubrerythrin